MSTLPKHHNSVIDCKQLWELAEAISSSSSLYYQLQKENLNTA